MNNPIISCQLNDADGRHEASLFDFANPEAAADVARFHQSLPNYKPTPLVKLACLANRLGLKELLIKDESQRFDLNAFKILGASYAMAKYLAKIAELENGQITYEKLLAKQPHYKNTTFVTATDGNHGRAVAWAASLFGCKSVVFLPAGSSQTRLKAIQTAGAKAEITDLNYDDTVLHARKMAGEQGWILLQDTSWEGYEEIPLDIMQGYFTLMTEFTQQAPTIWPTHVFLQAGVGSLAAAVLAYLYSIDSRPTPYFIVVEPNGAPCLYESVRLNNGEPYRVAGDLPTIMAGLACGEPALVGLKILKSASLAFLKCSDDVARRGMKVLGNPLAGDPAITSGESGAATLGAVYELLTNKQLTETRDKLKLSNDSTVLLISTEGDTDPDFYREIVWS
ncbi:MAG: diaminopropionate ammonia-lyase [Proteobacteria bacterium]|nr:diaminopropionate ammonia-lyase [Pseudomonadota bacterium]